MMNDQHSLRWDDAFAVERTSSDTAKAYSYHLVDLDLPYEVQP